MSDDAIARRLAKLVEIAGSQRKFAKIVGKTDPAVHGWLRGSVPYPNTLAQIAQRTDVSPEWLATGEGHEETELGNFRRLLESGGPIRRPVGRLAEEPAQYHVRGLGGLKPRKIPLITIAQAGELTSWEDIDDFEGIDSFATDPRALAVRIRGDSMAPDYKEGTIAILYPSIPPRSDNLVVARLTDGSVLFKRLHIAGDKYHFLSINPAYAPIIVTKDQIERMFPVGKTERNEL